ncbi:ribosomal protein L22 [Polychaeton citri CBS 116435]|uniref:Ribosomal protein L22 n=1 Tax=Polychaeton citri CBS 116435 TaxID=1314669 RepID=A0A9P4UNR0_9PEZI|nr:ribosomal protein L22 [Polychaeton citri CBS 116435]
MSLSMPARRFSSRCLYYRQHPTPRIQHLQRRTAFFGSRKLNASNDRRGGANDDRPNPVLEEFQRKHADLLRPIDPSKNAQAQQQQFRSGDISTSSLLEDADSTTKSTDVLDPSSTEAVEARKTLELGGRKRNPEQIARVLNPQPNPRERWERKKVIQLIRKDGRLTKEEILKRTEREHLAKSYEFKTSVKKLGMLARQIAGKTLDDAILQMRFSKKKVAQEVLKHLEYARDQAVVTRGMGIGLASMPSLPQPISLLSPPSAPQPLAPSSEDGSISVQIELKKDGKRHTVTDPSKIYVDQAWVGRGAYGRGLDHRARGRVNILRTPFTTLTVLLKEEATRVREYAEKEERRLKQRLNKVWTPMPERVIYGQRQWYSW